VVRSLGEVEATPVADHGGPWNGGAPSVPPELKARVEPILGTVTVMPTRRLDVCVAGPLGGVPLRVVEVGPLGPIGEPAMFTHIDRFHHYLSAARTARGTQPQVRVDVWDDAYVFPNTVPRVFGACRDAGFKTVHVRGRVRTLSGEWREFDDVPVDVNELAAPADAKSQGGGGGGKAGGCVFRPLPCRAPAYEP